MPPITKTLNSIRKRNPPSYFLWCPEWESNPQQGCDPSRLLMPLRLPISSSGHVEQATGIEPASSAWKADILPLNYTCMVFQTGFEPATSWSQTRRATKLRHWKIITQRNISLRSSYLRPPLPLRPPHLPIVFTPVRRKKSCLAIFSSIVRHRAIGLDIVADSYFTVCAL